MSTTSENYYLTHYKKLKGKFLVDVVEDKDGVNGEPMYGLVFKSSPKDRKPSVAWIYRDEEGNGPGFLDILEVDLDAKK